MTNLKHTISLTISGFFTLFQTGNVFIAKRLNKDISPIEVLAR